MKVNRIYSEWDRQQNALLEQRIDPKFVEHEVRFNQDFIGSFQFVVEELKRYIPTHLSINETDIISDTEVRMRVSQSGTTVIRKTQIASVLGDDWKYNLSTEIPVERFSGKINLYRDKLRTRFTYKENYFVDCSIVREYNEHYVLSDTRYEIELEMQYLDASKSRELNNLIEMIRHMLKGTQFSYIEPPYDSIRSLLNSNSKANADFSLNRELYQMIPLSVDKLNSLILDSYVITPKADGLRALFLINERQIWIVTNTFSNLVFVSPTRFEQSGTLIEGEFIPYEKIPARHRDLIGKRALFIPHDIHAYADDKSTVDVTKLAYSARMPFVETTMKTLIGSEQASDVQWKINKNLCVIMKPFSKIGDYDQLVWYFERMSELDYKFETDGFVFIPEKMAPNPRGRVEYEQLKYKPDEKRTVDLMVRTQNFYPRLYSSTDTDLSDIYKPDLTHGYLNNVVYEFAKNATGELIPQRQRFDKKYGNSDAVVKSVFSKETNISKELFTGRSLQAMRSHNLQVKSKAYRLLINTSPVNVHVEIGAGRGGDISRYPVPMDKYILIEPDANNVAELVRRITTNTRLNNKTVIIVRNDTDIGALNFNNYKYIILNTGLSSEDTLIDKFFQTTKFKFSTAAAMFSLNLIYHTPGGEQALHNLFSRYANHRELSFIYSIVSGPLLMTNFGSSYESDLMKIQIQLDKGVPIVKIFLEGTMVGSKADPQTEAFISADQIGRIFHENNVVTPEPGVFMTKDAILLTKCTQYGICYRIK